MKNLLMISILSLLAIGCGKKTETIEGSPGADGTSCYSETRADGNYVVCGDSEFKVENGQDGVDGADGVDGEDGKDGEDGVDGVDGQDGEDGSFDGYLELVEICPEKSGNHIETLLYLDGQYMAFLTDPNYKKQRLVIMKEDTLFKTTDGRNIKFTIDNGDILYVTNGCANYEPVQ